MASLSVVPEICDAYGDNLHCLYALSWRYAQDGKLAVDANSGIVLNANPAAEGLLGYSR
jgi:hypothetical protein